MAQNENNEPLQDYSSTQVVVGLGTTGQLALASNSALLMRSGKNLDRETYYVRFDASDPPLDNLATLLEVDPHKLLGADEFVCSTVDGDAASIDAWERSGKLRFLSQDSRKYLASQIEKEAAGGDPCFGLSQYLIRQDEDHDKIDTQIRFARSYDRQTERLVNENQAEMISSRLTVMFIASALGGTGSAGVYHALEITAPWLNSKPGQNFDIKVCVLLSFTLPVQDRRRAAANQYNLLKHTGAFSTSRYCHPITGKPQPWPLNELWLISDQGRWGVISDYERCVGVVGHIINTVQHRPEGRKARERLRDCQNGDRDEWGESRCVMSPGQAYISWDRGRSSGFCYSQAASNLTSWLLAADNPQATRQQARELAETCGLIESDDRNEVSGPLLQTQVDGEPVLERARNLLSDLVESARGSKDVIAAYQGALEDFRQGIQPDDFEPAIKAQARRRRKNAVEALEQSFYQMQKTPEGLQVALRCVTLVQRIVAQSREAILNKKEGLHQLSQSLADNIAEATERWEQWTRASWFAQRIRFILPHQVAAVLAESVPMLVETELQIAVCDAALDEFITPVLDWLQKKQVELQLHRQNIQAAQTSFGQLAQKNLHKSSKMTTPVGVDLTDREGYLPDFCQMLLQRLGGPDQLNRDLLARLLDQHGSLADLVATSAQGLCEIFVDVIQEAFKPLIASCNVITELERLFPTEQDKDQLFQECIRQSEGSLPIVPEVDYPEVCVKVVGVPDADHLDNIRSRCERLSPKSSAWEGVLHHDRDRICLVQIRTHLRLSPLIRMFEPAGRKELEEYARRSPYPASTVMIGPQPNDRQLKLVLAKALACDLLHYDAAEGYLLHCNDENVPLGVDDGRARETLRHGWRESVYIQTYFYHRLVVAEERLRARISQLEQALSSPREGRDHALNLIDQRALLEAQHDLMFLLPSAKRMRTALPKDIGYETTTYHPAERTAD